MHCVVSGVAFVATGIRVIVYGYSHSMMCARSMLVQNALHIIGVALAARAIDEQIYVRYVNEVEAQNQSWLRVGRFDSRVSYTEEVSEG